MKHDTETRFGEYLHQLRQARKLGVRELARKSGLDAGGLTRLEQGKTSPQPDTLKALGTALEVPFADLFAMAGYVTPSDLPSMSAYLHTRYGQLPEDTLSQVNEYIQHLVNERGLDPNGPAPHEDETEMPPRR
ncbi:helix-turn-helix protein [Streptomyces sp. 846.5]|nr:helix-turn-helix transcriptional regulator [Streptomyces sp. 846.5]TDU06596.1 helix-turn-helix protein [Streptomyces sp. 846.5]